MNLESIFYVSIFNFLLKLQMFDWQAELQSYMNLVLQVIRETALSFPMC